ncbi:nucleotidyltransferase family protein [Sinisalibacter aestuarii]|uniref:Molybdopterin-guanine dinucleotide biosynthesis protein A n=1 Tax=Sinisalibacter aestuarii TaxID=2949426 RepID=A0ABQ5LVH9_9RHOB|nr:nucleotidyltransferase family protein [Sinisalibacter aestuarii]GKY88982.1 molybdopterin-guanine dinucleotide biosynthesis protein A [Sinisalibacter aestuarii]
MSLPTILILAAGASSRMEGGDKVMEPVRGMALLEERARAALGTGAPVLVALPPADAFPARWAALDDLGVPRLTVRKAGDGMSASLAAGVDALDDRTPGVMILPADMPDITRDDMRALLDAFDGNAILRGAAADGRPGHPVLFPRRDFPALLALSGDTGARMVLRQEAARVRLVPLPGTHALTDLDTPEDWQSWRAANPER